MENFHGNFGRYDFFLPKFDVQKRKRKFRMILGSNVNIEIYVISRKLYIRSLVNYMVDSMSTEYGYSEKEKTHLIFQ